MQGKNSRNIQRLGLCKVKIAEKAGCLMCSQCLIMNDSLHLEAGVKLVEKYE